MSSGSFSTSKFSQLGYLCHKELETAFWNSVPEYSSIFLMPTENRIFHGRISMDGVEEFLSAIENGNWHRIDELALQVGWTVSKARRLAEFLSEHGLVHYRTKNETVRIDSGLLALLKET